jgi:hypothetical protein
MNEMRIAECEIRNPKEKAGYAIMLLTRSASFALVLLAVLYAGAPVFGEEGSPSGVMSLVVENDFFYDSDREYTNGIALAWVPSEESTPDSIVRIARWIPWFPEEGPVRHGYGFGQNMYTPRDITIANPPAGDRPYAGWLYGAIGVGVETGRQLDQFALTVGVLGPASLADHSQTFVHRVVNTNLPRGWDTQLRNEPGMYVTCQRSWRELAAKTLVGLDFDLTPHLGGALGNIYTYANTGFTLRYGKNLPLDYGPPRIQPSLPGSGYLVPTRSFDWYFFAGIEGRAVARNIFLDGNTFKDSRSVKKEPFVGDLQWGIVVTWRAYRLSFTHVVRTREFETQGERDQFGAFSLSMWM